MSNNRKSRKEIAAQIAEITAPDALPLAPVTDDVQARIDAAVAEALSKALAPVAKASKAKTVGRDMSAFSPFAATVLAFTDLRTVGENNRARLCALVADNKRISLVALSALLGNYVGKAGRVEPYTPSLILEKLPRINSDFFARRAPFAIRAEKDGDVAVLQLYARKEEIADGTSEFLPVAPATVAAPTVEISENEVEQAAE
jgi:hypothetical protein